MKKPKKRKPKTNEWYRKKAVILAKKIVRIQADHTCAYCSRKRPNVAIHGSHIYPEGTYKSMSADLENILTLCYTHHIGAYNGTEPSWHQNPLEMTEWFTKKYPERYKELRLRTQTIRQVNFEKKYNELKDILKNL